MSSSRTSERFAGPAEGAGVPHAVAGLAGGQRDHVDERRGGRLADDLADRQPAVMVALVQTASTLPVFLLGLPSGALADIVDRRRYFAVTQLWVASVAVLLCAARSAGG
jgi:MFS family permease